MSPTTRPPESTARTAETLAQCFHDPYGLRRAIVGLQSAIELTHQIAAEARDRADMYEHEWNALYAATRVAREDVETLKGALADLVPELHDII